MHKLALTGLALAAANCARAQEAPVRQATPLRISVDRVSVGVTVSDAQGRFLRDLKRKDFRVYDNGVEQAIADFLPVEEPAQVLLLIESGPAVLFFARNHVLAADAMVAHLAPDDAVAIAEYTREPETVIGFTEDKTAARMALQGISFSQGFGELNLFSSIASAVEALADHSGKKAIVLLSTGVDTSKDVNWGALQAKLQTADVRILAVSLSAGIRNPANRRKPSEREKEQQEQVQQGFAQADESLRKLTSATGGRAYFARTQQEFENAYAQIADLLRHEYSLTFAPPALDGKVHELRVEVDRDGAQLEYRPAYLAGIPGENPQ